MKESWNIGPKAGLLTHLLFVYATGVGDGCIPLLAE